MSVAPKLLDCQINMTYYVKNHEILMTYFGNEEQIPSKHHFNCNFYFLKNNGKSV